MGDSDDPAKNRGIRDRFEREEIEDILFVITYSGRTPEWPTWRYSKPGWNHSAP